MIARLICALLGHVFAAPPAQAGGHVFGTCARCRRYVVERVSP